ncbi:MAG TPA: methyltransferase domain-containing protein, partial [Acidimicrobiia bacterium]|nr:methyltransferase domain-containing protein [Acidimicrobiia bacterium]
AAFCDLDLSTPIHDLARVIDAARRAPVVAIGSRDVAASTITRHEGIAREFLGRAYNRAVQVAVTPGILDTQCGAKAARTELWHRVLRRCNEQGFAWDVEVVAMSQQLGIAVQEVPIEWHHDQGSRVHVLRDGIAMLRALPRIRANIKSSVGARNMPGDDAHWWFRSKAAFVAWAVRRWRPGDGWLLDLGGGSGTVTFRVAWPPERTLIVDTSAELVSQAKFRLPLETMRADVTRLPLRRASASIVFLLDVIEHLEEPRRALVEARRVIAPDGLLIVNVPGHPRLWSASDEVLGHRRRYSAASLRSELDQGGFEVLFLSHIFSWLALPMWAVRRRRASNPRLGLDMTSPVFDRAALFLTRIVQAVVGRVSLPVGTSVFCVAKPRRAADRDA